jgi:hypothetical protein
VGRRYPEALDELSKIFLHGGLLSPLVGAEEHSRKNCHEGKGEEIRVSDWEDAE